MAKIGKVILSRSSSFSLKDKISARRPSYQNSHSQRDEGDGDVLQQQRPPPEGAVCLLLPLPRGRRRGRDGTVYRVQLHQFCRIFDTLAWEILCESETIPNIRLEVSRTMAQPIPHKNP